MSLARRLLLGLACLVGLVAARATGSATNDTAAPAEWPAHPRLLAREGTWQTLRVRLAAEPALAAFSDALVAEARARAALPPVQRVMTGRRLLHVSRELLHRVLLFSYAARVTGEESFVRRAESEMLAAARFSDWNPEHFLDVGEATAALALGYDWLHAQLAPAASDEIRRAIVEKGLRPGLDPKDRRNSWQRAENNWNQVCFGGLTLGALAVADEAPAEAQRVLDLARVGIAHGLKPYAPDGVYPEGPSYWAYGTSYQVLMLAALESALDTDWGLSASPGFLASAGGYLQLTGPSGHSFNFSDGGERLDFEPAVFWFARRTGDAGLLRFEMQRLSGKNGLAAAARSNRFAPLAALWWPTSAAAAPRLPLDWRGDGANPVVVFRESWAAPGSAYLAAKGGAAGLNHAHMDAGTFVYEVDGMRWAIDLGMQDYESLESKKIDLWNRAQNSPRWSVYRLANVSHNTLTLGGARHRVDGRATVEHFVSDGARRVAVLDLSPVFAGQAQRVRRGFALQPDRGFVVRDEIAGLAPATSVRWQFATRAEVELRGTTAVLRQNGRSLTVRLLDAPAGTEFAAAPAQPPDDGFNARNPGVTLVSVTFTPLDSSDASVTVQFSPGEHTGNPPPPRPLAEW